jgi:hypothetical protein
MYNMPITIGYFSWERINHFPFIFYGKNSCGISPRIWNGLMTYTEVPLYFLNPYVWHVYSCSKREALPHYTSRLPPGTESYFTDLSCAVFRVIFSDSLSV